MDKVCFDMKSAAVLTLVLYGCFSFPGERTAAQAQIIPGGVEPGPIDREFEERIAPKSTGKIIVPAPSAEMPPDNAASIRFILRDLAVEGSSIYGNARLRPLYERFLGQEITLATVFAIANEITRMYAEDGYALSIGFVPAQEIEDGTVRIAVAEGYVDEIDIRATGNVPQARLAYYAEKIRASRPLRTEVLERYLLLANDMFGLDVRGTFERGDTGTGATRLVLDAKQRGLDINASYNNRGSDALGPWRLGMGADVNSALGRGSQFSYNRITSQEPGELVYQAYGFSMPVRGEGSVLSLDLIKTDSEPGTDILKTLEFASDGTTARLGLTTPFIRTRQKNFTSTVSFEMKDLESDVLGVPNSKDELRVLRLGGSYDFIDARSNLTQIGLTFSKGLDILDATPEDSPTKSRENGVPDFTSIAVDLYRLQRLGSRWSLATSLSAQQAIDPLLSSEQCGYGGGRYGRGYDNFELSGDGCFKGSFELQMRLKSRGDKIDGMQLYGFYDIGKVWQEGDILPGELKDETAASAGAGLRMSLAGRVTASVEYAKPLDHDVALEGNDDARVFFSLSFRN